MYAVIKTGGKQYKVEKNQVLEIEKLSKANKDDEVIFDEVLLVKTDDGEIKIGNPTVASAVVKAKSLGNQKGEKIIIQKFRRRKRYKVKTGHRQEYTTVKVLDIVLN